MKYIEFSSLVEIDFRIQTGPNPRWKSSQRVLMHFHRNCFRFEEQEIQQSSFICLKCLDVNLNLQNMKIYSVVERYFKRFQLLHLLFINKGVLMFPRSFINEFWMLHSLCQKQFRNIQSWSLKWPIFWKQICGHIFRQNARNCWTEWLGEKK